MLIASGFSFVCNFQAECKYNKKNKKEKVIAPISVPSNAPKEQNIFDVPLNDAPSTLPPRAVNGNNEDSKRFTEVKSKNSNLEIKFGNDRRNTLPPTEMANPIHDAQHR